MDLFGIIGNPLGHSISAEYFTKKFAVEESLDTKEYRVFELPTIDALPAMVAHHRDLRGFNVTIPYKVSVLKYLDELSPEAREIGAVNCVKIGEDGRMTGYNTDCEAFRESLVDFLHQRRPKALVLGTGGASKAVQFALRKVGIDFRTVSHSGNGQMDYSQLSREMAERQLIVNCTPLGMAPNIKDCPPIPYELLTEQHLLFDLIYNPPTSEFLRQGQRHGTSICNGQRMFVLQAEASWRIFGRQ